MIRISRRHILVRAAWCIVAASLLATPALAAKRKPKDPNAITGKVQRAGKIQFIRGSEETSRERERRLTRECKGRPNAGACLGYGG